MDPEDNETSLSEFHDYEPSLEFDDSELIQAPGLGKIILENFPEFVYITN